MAKNWKPTLNSIHFNRQSKGLKEVFKKLGLNIKSFDNSVLAALCKNKLGDKIAISEIKRNNEILTTTICPSEIDIDGEYNSVDEFLKDFKNKVLTSISNKNIDMKSISNLYAATEIDSDEFSVEDGLELTITHSGLEHEDTYKNRLELAEQRNTLIEKYDDILALARSENDAIIARKNNAKEIDKEIEKLQERKKRLLG